MDAVPRPVIEKVNGTQTLLRGLALLECVAEGAHHIQDIARQLGTPRSTTHRILQSLVAAGYLHRLPYQGYTLGYRLMHLGTQAYEQRPLAALARPFLERLATRIGDAVHLGTREERHVLYLDKVPGKRGLEMRSRIGQCMPLASTGLGKALILDQSTAGWKALYDEAMAEKGSRGEWPRLAPWPEYDAAMRRYQQQGWVMDREENELGICCVAAPVRDFSGAIIAAVSVASAVPYMPIDRMQQLGPHLLAISNRISQALGMDKTRR